MAHTTKKKKKKKIIILIEQAWQTSYLPEQNYLFGGTCQWLFVDFHHYFWFSF